MSDQTLNPEQNERAERWEKRKYLIAGVIVLLCLYSIFAGEVPNPPLAVFFGILATYIIRS